MQNIFYQGNKRKQVPSNQEQEKLESFFNCAATLMTQNLQNLTLDSTKDYTELLVQPEVGPFFSNCLPIVLRSLVIHFYCTFYIYSLLDFAIWIFQDFQKYGKI